MTFHSYTSYPLTQGRLQHELKSDNTILKSPPWWAPLHCREHFLFSLGHRKGKLSSLTLYRPMDRRVLSILWSESFGYMVLLLLYTILGWKSHLGPDTTKRERVERNIGVKSKTISGPHSCRYVTHCSSCTNKDQCALQKLQPTQAHWIVFFFKCVIILVLLMN